MDKIQSGLALHVKRMAIDFVTYFRRMRTFYLGPANIFSFGPTILQTLVEDADLALDHLFPTL